jgi:hypothetical protein
MDTLHLRRDGGGRKNNKAIYSAFSAAFKEALNGSVVPHGNFVKITDVRHRPGGDFFRINVSMKINNH